MRPFSSLFWLMLIACAAFVGGRACFFFINPGEDSQSNLHIASAQNADVRSDVTFVSPYKATAIPQSDVLTNVSSSSVETSNDSLLKTASEGLNGLSQQPFTLLLAMSDVNNPPNAQFARGGYALVRVDVAHNILDCVALPADLQVSLANGRKDRLDNVMPLSTGLTADNVKLLKQTLESNLRIGIDYYLIMSNEGFARAIDQMGTVAIMLPAETTPSKTGSVSLAATTPTRSAPLKFNGTQLVRYLTYRENISDADRLWKIRAIAEALIWVSQRSDAFGQVVALYVELAPDYQTNLEPARMLGLGLFLKSLASEQIGVRAIDSTMITNVKGSIVQNDNEILRLFAGWR